MEIDLKASKTTITSFFIAAALIKPGYFNQIPVLSLLYKILPLIAYIIVIVEVYKKWHQYKPSLYIIMCGLLFMELLYSTYRNDGEIGTCIHYCLTSFLPVLYMDAVEDFKFEKALKGILLWGAFLTTANFVTVILFPNGLYSGFKSEWETYYFLGHNNSAARIVIPVIIISAVYDCLTKSKISLRTWFLAVISILTVTLTWSNTGMVGIFIILIALIIVTKKKKDNTKSMKASRFTGKILFIFPIICFAVLVLQNQWDISTYIAVHLFHKSADFTGRTVLWKAALSAISQNPLWGYGYGVVLNDVVQLSAEPSSCHNYFLDLAFRGGVFQIAIQLVINWICCLKLNNKQSAITTLLIFALLSYFVMWQVEPFISSGVSLMYIIFLLCYKNHRLNSIQQGENMF